ncbi:unnamed protein product [Bursaphelenchus okinawaensis]|uniref:Uncharacterized protein n=1 Tax=Bursaphelenchus okinawaensis TaxID=465554 RepID=A0A811JQ78_9BILA|nr:unnamed protein product [Bursaphelenchus okinawaensis]CAG9077728.1 unnamed protein product [Bursaphelenchus okinawaensis]
MSSDEEKKDISPGHSEVRAHRLSAPSSTDENDNTRRTNRNEPTSSASNDKRDSIQKLATLLKNRSKNRSKKQSVRASPRRKSPRSRRNISSSMSSRLIFKLIKIRKKSSVRPLRQKVSCVFPVQDEMPKMLPNRKKWNQKNVSYQYDQRKAAAEMHRQLMRKQKYVRCCRHWTAVLFLFGVIANVIGYAVLNVTHLILGTERHEREGLDQPWIWPKGFNNWGDSYMFRNRTYVTDILQCTRPDNISIGTAVDWINDSNSSKYIFRNLTEGIIYRFENIDDFTKLVDGN